jgi:hypothetical protein
MKDSADIFSRWSYLATHSPKAWDLGVPPCISAFTRANYRETQYLAIREANVRIDSEE